MWWLVCGGAGVLGLLGGLAVSPAGVAVPLAISVGGIGALVGVGCRLSFQPLPEADFGRAVLRSAGLGVIAVFGLVLPFLVLGRLWFAGALLLAVTSPPCIRWCRSRWGGPSFFHESSGIDTEQWTAWVMSARALEHPLSPADATVLVAVRQQMLDELVARHGTIPVELWSTGTSHVW